MRKGDAVQLEATRIFTENAYSTAFINLNRGGTRSSKTYSLIQLAAIWLIHGKVGDREGGKVWSVIRLTRPSLTATAYRDFKEVIFNLRYDMHIIENKVEGTFRFKGRLVEFFGIDNQQKVRSRKRDYGHLVECNEMPYATYLQIIIRTKMGLFLDFNPSESDSWMRTEIEELRKNVQGDVKVIVSSYIDNPHLSKQEKQNIEFLKISDPELWAIFGEGEYGQLTGLVYPNWKEAPYPTEWDEERIGIDFGFGNHPATAVKIARSGRKYYLKELVYESGLTNQELAAILKAHDVKQTPIAADSAEPKSIRELQVEGLNVIGAKKGADSVRNGILYVRGLDIYYDPTSVNIAKERRSYKYLDEHAQVPIKFMDHSLDAIRYCINTFYKQNTKFISGGVISHGK